MKIQTSATFRESGNTLVTVLVIGGVMSVVLAGILSLSNTTVRQSYSQADWNSAYFHAQNALNWAVQQAVDSQPAAGSSNYYSTANGTLTLAYMNNSSSSSSSSGTGSSGDSSSGNSTNAVVSTNSSAASVNYNKTASQSGFKNACVSVVNTNSALPNTFLFTASAQVGNAVRTVQSAVIVNPPSLVFDYEYFLNNWGWWWGSTITGNGGQRANWDFDFRSNPTVNGVIYAS